VFIFNKFSFQLNKTQKIKYFFKKFKYVNQNFIGMQAAKDPINLDIELDLDETIGEVPLVAEDFSRVILNSPGEASVFTIYPEQKD